jgi:hypothetical protein
MWGLGLIAEARRMHALNPSERHLDQVVTREDLDHQLEFV